MYHVYIKKISEFYKALSLIKLKLQNFLKIKYLYFNQ